MWLANSLGQGFSSVAVSKIFKKFLHFMELKVYQQTHQSPPLVPILNQLNSVHVLSHFLKIIFIIIIIPSNPRSSNVSIFFRLYQQNALYTYLLPHISRPMHRRNKTKFSVFLNVCLKFSLSLTACILHCV
jgi:hypothetical protein